MVHSMGGRGWRQNPQLQGSRSPGEGDHGRPHTMSSTQDLSTDAGEPAGGKRKATNDLARWSLSFTTNPSNSKSQLSPTGHPGSILKLHSQTHLYP